MYNVDIMHGDVSVFFIVGNLTFYVTICLTCYVTICLTCYVTICLTCYVTICLTRYVTICLTCYVTICFPIANSRQLSLPKGPRSYLFRPNRVISSCSAT